MIFTVVECRYKDVWIIRRQKPIEGVGRKISRGGANKIQLQGNPVPRAPSKKWRPFLEKYTFSAKFLPF